MREFVVWILALEDARYGVDVEVFKGAISGQRSGVMANIKLSIVRPYIGLYGDAASLDGAVERDFAPVVVVRMNRFRENVAGERSRV